MNNYCIEILGLNYLNLFKKFNLNIQKNVFSTISGSNNCGKTTLIKLIDGQLYSRNTISIFGKQYDEYKITEISNILKTVIPLEFTITQNTVEEELLYQLPIDMNKTTCGKKTKEIAKIFGLTKLLTKSVESLANKELIKLQLATALISNPQILVIDDIYPYFSKEETLEICEKLKEIKDKQDISIIMVTSLLDCNLLSDYSYIIDNGQVVLEGRPIEVLEKDNILNKAGLNLPFMMDLSVKLRDYDLIEDIELDMEKMVNMLWK